MKLFENGVGRPSNEIKRKRKIFISSAVILCMALVSVLAFTLTKVSTNRLQGAVSYELKDVQLKFKITNAWWSGPGSNHKKFNINTTDTSRAYSYIAVSCKSYDACKASNAWDKAGSGNRTGRVTITKGNNKTAKIYYTDYNKLPGTKFYLRVTTYNSANTWLAVDVYEVKVNDGKRNCNAGYCYPVSTTRKWGTYNKNYVAEKTTTTSNKLNENDANLDMQITNAWWSGPGSNHKKFNINVTNTSKAYNYIAVSCKSYDACKASDAWDKAGSGNRTSSVIITKGNNKTAKIYYTDYNKLPGTKFYLRTTTYNSAGTWLVVDVYEVKVNDGKRSCGAGYCYPVTTTWKWSTVNSKYVNKASTSDHYKAPASQPAAKTLKITCPTNGNINKEIKCTADQAVKFTVGGSKALANGYKSTVTNAKSVNIKYTGTLFNGTWDTKKDSKGKEYVVATVKAEKSGYKTVTKKINIYKGTLELDCPTSAKTNELFKCTTDQAGVKITVGGAKALASGYSSSFTTKSSDKTKDIKYTDTLFNGTWDIKKDSDGKEYVNALVKAEKTGYETQKTVKIYKGTAPSSGGGSNGGTTSSTPKNLTLTCPASAKVNEAFKCTTNLTGVKLTVGGAKALASGYKATFTTTKDDKTKGAKYTNTLFNGTWTIRKDSDGKEYVVATVTAEKSGYTKITKKVKIYSGKVSSNGGTTTKKTTGKTTSKITTTKKPTTTASSTFAPYNINYSITKVTKKGDNGEKSLEFKISKVGSDVKYVNHAICFERDACITGDETRYKAMTAVVEANKGTTYSLDITTENPGLLNQDFYVRVMTYDKDKNFIYYKTHHFHTNPKTSSNSTNSSISDESRIQIGDFTGTTHDFLFSLKCKNVNEKYKANYAIPSVKKASEIDIDSGVKKIVNIAMHDFGEDVKYVSFAVCIKEKSCKKNNTILYVSEDSERGAVLQYQVPERGKEYPIELIAENDKMLKQKFYVRIYTYDANKMLLYSKIHEFTTGESSKLGYKKESEIKVGDRVISESTDYLGSKKYIN